MTIADDEAFMTLALLEASQAELEGDVPVGAIVVDKTGSIVGRGRNRREKDQDPTSHAEIEAIRAAAKTLGQWRLIDCTVYCTLEPCAMCAGALVHARIGRLVYGPPDPKGGSVRTLFEIGTDTRLNHRFTVTSGVLESECSQKLSRFFQKKRQQSS